MVDYLYCQLILQYKVASTFVGTNHVINGVMDEPYLSPLHYIYTSILNRGISGVTFVQKTICFAGDPTIRDSWKLDTNARLGQTSVYSKDVVKASQIRSLDPIHDRARIVRQDLFRLCQNSVACSVDDDF